MIAGSNDAADVARCLAARELQSFPKPDTIADGLRGATACCASCPAQRCNKWSVANIMAPFGGMHDEHI